MIKMLKFSLDTSASVRLRLSQRPRLMPNSSLTVMDTPLMDTPVFMVDMDTHTGNY